MESSTESEDEDDRKLIGSLVIQKFPYVAIGIAGCT